MRVADAKEQDERGAVLNPEQGELGRSLGTISSIPAATPSSLF